MIVEATTSCDSFPYISYFLCYCTLKGENNVSEIYLPYFHLSGKAKLYCIYEIPKIVMV